jgi:predicted nucleic acid-binding protein
LKAFLDTSVLVATFYADHDDHEPSINLFLRYDKTEICCAAHSMAEVFSSLTGMPGKHRVTADEAMLFLGNVRERLTIVTLNEKEYFKAIEASATAGITGGAIYDALLGHCALKADAETIYTWNLKDFKRLGPSIAARVQTPRRSS